MIPQSVKHSLWRLGSQNSDPRRVEAVRPDNWPGIPVAMKIEDRPC